MSAVPPPPPPTNAPPPNNTAQPHQPPPHAPNVASAAAALSAEQLFHLRPVVQHFAAVRSAYARDAFGRHLLCLVDDTDQLFLHQTTAYGPGQPRCLRSVQWFRDEGKRVQDMCFDATGAMLLVLCYENTLHTVPVSWVLDGQPNFEHFHMAGDRITSFVVPFAGPHNCPNSKTCPNNMPPSSSGFATAINTTFTATDDPDGVNNNSNNSDRNARQSQRRRRRDDAVDGDDNAVVNHDDNDDGLDDSQLQLQWSPLADAYDDQMVTSPLLLSPAAGLLLAERSPCDPCPYPTSVVWWQTLTAEGKHRAIVGYSDGTICIVGLEPHCPLVAHTCIERGGAVMEMVICRDSVLNNVTLMITAKSREQWKLMLEQKSIGYTFPGNEKEHFYSASSSRQNSKESHDPPNHNADPNRVATATSAGPHAQCAPINNDYLEDWQIVVPINKPLPDVPDNSAEANNTPEDSNNTTTSSSSTASPAGPGILPSARARLVSLKELGAKKIGALKLKLAENRTQRPDDSNDSVGSSARSGTAGGATYAILDALPLLVPERLTTAGGPFFIVQQQLGGKCVLSALHEHSDTLSLHSIDVSPIPLCIYKVPVRCRRVLVTPHLMYTVSGGPPLGAESGEMVPPAPFVVSVIGTSVAELRIGEEADLQTTSMLGRFELAADERVLALYRMDEPLQLLAAAVAAANGGAGGVAPKLPWRSGNDATTQLAETINNNYVRKMHYMRASQRGAEKRGGTTATTNTTTNKSTAAAKSPPPQQLEDERRFLRTDFPDLCVDGCILVTSCGAYVLELRDTGRDVFCAIARRGGWAVCEEFCRTFKLNFTQCVEFAGDEMLRGGDTRQALQCYNVARIPSVKTALKLAMFGENNALMHLCAMALKTLYILKSSRPLSYHINNLQELHDARFNSGADEAKRPLTAAQQLAAGCAGLLCTDFSYEKDEAVTDLQMSNSSQFHLSNLLLLTLTERTIKDKRCMPLWNFLVTNKKYHPNMTSIVLCQSGLYYAAVLLACARGAHLDAFCGLVGVSNQEFGWYNELNKILLNLAEPMFMECIIYMYTVSLDYFAVVQNRIEQIEVEVLEKLCRQLDPFSAVFRPVVSQLDLNSTDADPEFITFCKSFIETFLLLLINIHARRNRRNTTDPTSPSPFANALSTMDGDHHEDSPVAVAVRHNSPLSAGFSHCACIVDGIVYAWGSNGVNCLLGAAAQPETPDVYSTPRPLQFLGQLNLVVHAVRCGRTHTLILTNNGLYSTGANQLGQLGIGMYTAQALQPMLVRAFDGRDVQMIEAGQYHNAVVADGKLYTWGWGVYGQLGHGNVEIVYEPRAVAFFEEITILQMALGHAHTLVLGTDTRTRTDHIYVFGSNHYGQLGVGQPGSADAGEPHVLKSLVPVVLSIAKPIRLIHTKFFTNFIITADNELYVWGASPQALRLQYQARKRAKATQKQEDEAAAAAAAAAASALLTPSDDADVVIVERASTPTPSVASSCDNIASRQDEHISADGALKPPRSKSLNDLQPSDAQSNAAPTNTSTATTAEHPQSPPMAAAPPTHDDTGDGSDHLYPTLVDTSDVIGTIMQISSGLYHSALVTDQRTLYTWGKNLEKQLGRDRSQFEYVRPTLLESIADAVHVECGADFTVCLAADLTVRAFGNSSFGQCGRDIASDRNGIVGKLVRLRISKRVVRIPDSTQCVEYPVNIALPRPQINLSHEPVRYLKRVPCFNRHMVVHCGLQGCEETPVVTPMEAPASAATMDTDATDAQRYPNDFIHYCLFLFHGVYDAQALLSRVTTVEFRVRILMLNYNIREAFALCLQQTANVRHAIRTFEYFTKDLNIVPIHREDLKFLIYELFVYCMSHGWEVRPVEEFLLEDMDHYLFALAYVLFFNNNNTDVERQVLAKFTDLFSDELNYNSVTAEWLEKSEQIFGAVSTGFKAIVCQKLFEYEDNFA